MASLGESTVASRLELLDWKRRVFSLYAEVRAADDPERAWDRWRAGRDELFASHPSSPLPEPDRPSFAGLSYFPYDPGLRVDAELVATASATVRIGTSGAEPIAAERFARARFELEGRAQELELYWLSAYAGGLLVAFADATSGSQTYGGGRYLLDTVKGSDLGGDGSRLVLDFNFAYNPSCCYDPRWTCPLSTRANRLEVAVRGGERAWAAPGGAGARLGHDLGIE